MISREQWNGLNTKIIHERSNELINFDGYVPSTLRRQINIEERNNYLKTNGTYDKIITQRKQKRQELKKTDDITEWLIDETLTFINKNPNFEDFIKIKGRRYKK
jgi:hypothetical protein